MAERRGHPPQVKGAKATAEDEVARLRAEVDALKKEKAEAAAAAAAKAVEGQT